MRRYSIMRNRKRKHFQISFQSNLAGIVFTKYYFRKKSATCRIKHEMNKESTKAKKGIAEISYFDRFLSKKKVKRMCPSL